MSKTIIQLDTDVTLSPARLIAVADALTGKLFKVSLSSIMNLLSGGTPGTGAKPTFYDCNADVNINGGDTLIDWDSTLIAKYGQIPHVEVWTEDGNGGYDRAQVPVQAIGKPPVSFVVRNGGQPGLIKIV